MYSTFKIRFLVPCLMAINILGIGSAQAEILLDPTILLHGGNELTGAVGYTLSSETDYEESNFGIDVEIERSSLDLAVYYPFRSDISFYGALEYNVDAEIPLLEQELDGFQLSIGGLKALDILPEYPTVAWAEVNFTRESYSSFDDEFNSSEKGDLSGMELSVGMFFQLYSTAQLSASAGGELILVSNGDTTETSTEVNNFGPAESETEKTGVDRADRVGLKVIVSYALSNSLRLNARLNIINENKLAIGVSRSF